MTKIVSKSQGPEKADLPENIDEIFKLKIDRDTQEFFIEGLDNYGKFSELTLRPLDVLNKLVAYNEDFEVTKESTLFRQLKDAKDSVGGDATNKDGIVCGRVVWKNLTSKFSEDEISTNKSKAKFYALVFGVAYVKGHEPVLVDFRVGGAKFMDITNIMNKIKDEKKEYNKAEIRIKATPNDEFDWPEVEYMVAFDRELPMTGLEPLYDTIEGFIEYHNAGIDKKAKAYAEKKANRGSGSGYKQKTSFKRK